MVSTAGSPVRSARPSQFWEGLRGREAHDEEQPLLGKFELREIPPAPRGQPQIKVTFGNGSNGFFI